MEGNLHIGVLLFALTCPVAKSIGHRKSDSSQWFTLYPALLITASIFSVWDYWFTQAGIWESNLRYLLRDFFYDLPLEEWLFVLVVAFVCVFIYEVLSYFFPKDVFQPAAKNFAYFTISALVVLGFFNLDKLYTSVDFLFGAFLLLFLFLIFEVSISLFLLNISIFEKSAAKKQLLNILVYRL